LKLRLGKSLAPQSFYSEVNFLTLIRLAHSFAFFILYILKENPPYIFIGFLVPRIGDFIDGYYACIPKQQTIIGAEIDSITDRSKLIVFYIISYE
jgi:phosphatidylglycerophosphate synthase